MRKVIVKKLQGTDGAAWARCHHHLLAGEFWLSRRLHCADAAADPASSRDGDRSRLTAPSACSAWTWRSRPSRSGRPTCRSRSGANFRTIRWRCLPTPFAGGLAQGIDRSRDGLSAGRRFRAAAGAMPAAGSRRRTRARAAPPDQDTGGDRADPQPGSNRRPGDLRQSRRGQGRRHRTRHCRRADAADLRTRRGELQAADHCDRRAQPVAECRADQSVS